MFDICTKSYLDAKLALLKTEIALLKTEIERDFHKALLAHSLAIIAVVTAVIAASHYWWT